MTVKLLFRRSSVDSLLIGAYFLQDLTVCTGHNSRSPAAVVVAALLLIGGVETNPGPGYDCISTTIPLTRYQSEPQDLKYSAESLKAFQHNIPPHRSIRKTLFQYHLLDTEQYYTVRTSIQRRRQKYSYF